MRCEWLWLVSVGVLGCRLVMLNGEALSVVVVLVVGVGGGVRFWISCSFSGVS